MKRASLLFALCMIAGNIPAAQGVEPLGSVPRVFNVVVDLTIGGHTEHIDGLAVESRRNTFTVNPVGPAGTDGSLRVNVLIVPYTRTGTGVATPAYYLSGQILRNAGGKWIVTGEPTIDIDSGTASMTLDGSGASDAIASLSVKEVSMEETAAYCSAVKKSEVSPGSVREKLLKLSSGGIRPQTCCAAGPHASCCWSVTLCCSTGSGGCCINDR
jgi:hypothetical protein